MFQLILILMSGVVSTLSVGISLGHAHAHEYLFSGKETVLKLSPTVSMWTLCQQAKSLADTHLRQQVLETVHLSLPPTVTFPVETMHYHKRQCTVTVTFRYVTSSTPRSPGKSFSQTINLPTR